MGGWIGARKYKGVVDYTIALKRKINRDFFSKIEHCVILPFFNHFTNLCRRVLN